ncbi:hypothetical protein I0C86_06905 [Plantactinospora sp. S1510]|uniref:Transcriptional regulator n=1 Tax=Plantactinospora alkalitolerans TaxID=2789879 RepID=A0ABS0GRA8_9ACTN|nr:hypothetical protein [Plantactinospora alkalitolerans]MBF9128717.1 hypothetical protein [Plantactinospora alkalitolerans]
MDRGADPGVGDDLLDSLPADAVVAYRGEPRASERAMLLWPMTAERRQAFGAGIEWVSNQLRTMDDERVGRFLDELADESRRLGLDTVPPPEEPSDGRGRSAG